MRGAPLSAPRRIVGLPVDGRPVVRAQVQQLVALAEGFELRCPEPAQLGHFREPADRDALAQWLLAQRDDAAAWVLSLDMLVYGGLVPSRFIDDDLDSLRARLELLRALRRPGVPLVAFAATMRISNNNVADEEKPYWREYGRDIWAWSYHGDRSQEGYEADRMAAAAAEARIPAEIRDDYRRTRFRNHAVTVAAIELVEAGVIDRLILPQDDTAAYGFNVCEHRQLGYEAADRHVQDRVLFYPGADEVMHTLCAWVVGRLRGDAPLKLALLPTDAGNCRWMVPRYEDQSLGETLEAQLDAVGAVLVDDGFDADAMLLLHTQGMAQGDWAMNEPLPERPGIDAAVWAALAQDLPLAVADDAMANGGDPVFIDRLAAALPLPSLIGYAGWNTSSNRLGSLLAQLVLGRHAWASPRNQDVVALRLAEDLQWQAVLRQRLRARIAARHGDEKAMAPERLEAEAAQLMREEGNAWLAQHGFAQRIVRAWLPWGRTFEIGLEVAR